MLNNFFWPLLGRKADNIAVYGDSDVLLLFQAVTIIRRLHYLHYLKKPQNNKNQQKTWPRISLVH